MKYLQIGFFLNVSFASDKLRVLLLKFLGPLVLSVTWQEMDSSSLIHLFIGGIQNSQLCCVAGAVFDFELPFWFHWLFTIAFSSEKVEYCIIEKTKAVLSHQHQEFGTLLLLLCDCWWLFSLPQLFFFVKYWTDSSCKSCVSLWLQTCLLLGVSNQSASQVLWE